MAVIGDIVVLAMTITTRNVGGKLDLDETITTTLLGALD